jgi:hypothetical protein
MDNVQKVNYCINMSSSQTLRSYVSSTCLLQFLDLYIHLGDDSTYLTSLHGLTSQKTALFKIQTISTSHLTGSDCVQINKAYRTSEFFWQDWLQFERKVNSCDLLVNYFLTILQQSSITNLQDWSARTSVANSAANINNLYSWLRNRDGDGRLRRWGSSWGICSCHPSIWNKYMIIALEQTLSHSSYFVKQSLTRWVTREKTQPSESTSTGVLVCLYKYPPMYEGTIPIISPVCWCYVCGNIFVTGWIVHISS